jgi:hypothetical protein
MQAMSDLRFELTALADCAEAGRPVPVRFRLVNRGRETVVVNGRLAVTETGRAGEVRLSGSGPDGQTVPFIADVNVGRPKAAHFATLPTDRCVERDDDLRRYLLLGEPGEYRVTAVYRNDSPGVDGMDAVAWTGELAAEPLILTLKPHEPSA